MKTSSKILTGLFMFLSLSLQAQKTGDQPQNPRITKGYYAIGTNHEKLAEGQKIKTTDSDSAQSVAKKGYYTIGDNSKKLKNKKLLSNNTDSAKKNDIKKGYYSIGNNAAKL